MSLYYQDESVTLYHGDCREILPLRADAILTDPPYAVRYDNAGAIEMLGFISPNWSEKATHSRGYADHDPEAFADLLTGAFRSCLSSLSGPGVMVTFGGNRTFHEMVTHAVATGWEMLDVLVFESGNGVAKSTTTLRPGHEIAALLRSPGVPAQINRDWKKSNVYALDKPRRAESEHLTTKPISWMHALVSDYSAPGQTVLDPFCGSGSALVAAKQLGRKAIGIELDEAHCEIAAKRLAQGVLSLEESA